eukprot:GILK01006285.1.p1 GENE.GILK01006285.1~~GILK01006285.1.p1  ORF type:complete len:333 (+),score=35.37 GILK01006285.1:40-999(+)
MAKSEERSSLALSSSFDRSSSFIMLASSPPRFGKRSISESSLQGPSSLTPRFAEFELDIDSEPRSVENDLAYARRAAKWEEERMARHQEKLQVKRQVGFEIKDKADTSSLTQELAAIPFDQPSENAKENGKDEGFPQPKATTEVAAAIKPHDSEPQIFIPPENFAMVSKGVYRSGFPKRKNFPFLKKVGIKSIVYMCPEDYPQSSLDFMEKEGMKLLQFGVSGNKEPFVDIPEDVICVALAEICDVRNHPLLIHCNKGKHRTGCVVGTLRKVQQWGLTSILDEYRRFAHPKARFMDQQFIELFKHKNVKYDKRYKPSWL